jgi:outer membrane lipoprotein-sorting protein
VPLKFALRPLRLRDGAGVVLSAVALVLAACTKDAPPPAPTIGDVKRVLAEREKRLLSFHIVVSTDEGEHHAEHEFWFRSPNKSRGHLLLPQEVELVFDGTKLVRVLYPARVVEPIPLDMPPQQRAFFLASTFMPFAPEGYRTPLLPMSGITVKQTADRVTLDVDPGEGVKVKYVLRWPSGDFLEKRTFSAGNERVLKVLAEKCDEKAKLCVPVKLEESLTGLDGAAEPLGRTEVSLVEFNPPVSEQFFSLSPTPARDAGTP